MLTHLFHQTLFILRDVAKGGDTGAIAFHPPERKNKTKFYRKIKK